MKDLTVGGIVGIIIFSFGLILVGGFTVFDFGSDCLPLWALNIIIILVFSLIAIINQGYYASESSYYDEDEYWYEKKPLKNMLY